MVPASTSPKSVRHFGAPASGTRDERAGVAEVLFAMLPLPAWIFDRKTLRFLAVNEAAVALYGYSREEFLAFTLDDLRVAEDRPGLRAHLARESSDGPQPLGRWRHRTRAGRVFPVEITRQHLTWMGRAAALVVVTDITEHMTSDETIRRLTVAVDQSPAAVVITDLQGNIDYVNRRFTEITGYGAAEAFGKNPRFLKSGLTPIEVYRDLWDTIGAGREWRGVVQNRRKNGELYWESATISPIRDAAGAVTHYVEISQDVTEQRLLEEQFRQAQKMEAVGRLAGGVAHDFNNLLSVITSCTELVIEDLGASDPRREDLEEVRKAAVQAATLTRQLLAFSRQQVLQPRVLDLNDVLGGAEKILRRLIGEDVALTTVLGSALGAVKADQGQIEQVIMNLVVNARDAMPDGGRLTIATSAVHLDADYADDHPPVVPGDYVLLTISDTGVGMDATTQRRIFEPFFTTKEKGKGTGLGLATVYGIVKQSGGFIWVYSEPAHGATFKIYLPRVEPPAGGEPEPVATGESLRGTETILIAEDSDAVRKVSREVLERHGYSVLDAPNGKAALEVAVWHSAPIQLLLTDVIMPEMSGRELADRLTGLRPDVRVLYFSGYTDDAIVRHGVLEEGIAYLEKPFTPDQLARKVREVLDAGRGG